MKLSHKKEYLNEDIFVELLKDKGYKTDNDIKIEQYSSDVIQMDKLLKNASKKGDRHGRPDFIITKASSDVAIIVECKSDNSDHEKACNEVNHYARFVSKGYDVVAIATSGTTTDSLKIDVFTWNKNAKNGEKASISNDILTFKEFENLLYLTPERKSIEISKLKGFAEELNNDIRSLLQEKSNSNDIMLLLSGILLALENSSFKKVYRSYKYNELAEEMVNAIKRTFKAHRIPAEKEKILLYSYEGLILSDALKVKNEDLNDTPLRYIIDKIMETVIPIREKYPNIDILANFYSEIIRYTVGDGKGGFVLTPSHITELFAELADLTTKTKVIDICTGTGGFLISAMANEIKKANGNRLLEQRIKENNFYGVEVDANRYTYACTNMILRGDGQSNIFNDDCFKIENKLQSIGAGVGFMNPPYSSDKGYKGPSELEFVDYLCDCLEEGGMAIVIIPKSCAKENKGSSLVIREKLLSKHTLEAVMSMPENLFGRDAGADTCLMVFTAKKPHPKNKKVWLANWVDDGYTLKRNKGRVDEEHRFEKEILPKWVSMFKNRDVIDRISLKKELSI